MLSLFGCARSKNSEENASRPADAKQTAASEETQKPKTSKTTDEPPKTDASESAEDTSAYPQTDASESAEDSSASPQTGAQTSSESTEPQNSEPPVETSTPETSLTVSSSAVEVEPMNAVMYASGNVNVRAEASASSERIGHLNKGDSVTVTGVTKSGWYRIVFKDKECFVSGSYLQSDKPAEQTAAPATEKPATDAATETEAPKTQNTVSETADANENPPAEDKKLEFTISDKLVQSENLGYKVKSSLEKAFKTVGNTNPISSNIFFADPTSVVYDGRLYVYGTCDQQSYISGGKTGGNDYGRINTLACFSTDDMKNWTYHGDIDVKAICPWTWCSWAPSIVSRQTAEGKTEFFLYFANSGGGIGVMKSDSPTGPWKDPIGRPLIDGGTKELSSDPVCWCFDPGVCIDDDGVGWLAFGGGDPMHNGETGLNTRNCRIVRLGKDMISLDSKITVIEAPYHFEANELNFVDGKYVLTYCSNWFERTEWPSKYKYAKPELCTMCYMVSDNPLKKGSWEYKGEYIKNPTGYGYPFSNNHTNFIKYGDKYYVFYQTVLLLKNMSFPNGTDGYRSLGVNELSVNEEAQTLSFGGMNDRGAAQIKCYNPFRVSEAATANVFAGTDFKKDGSSVVVSTKNGSWSAICKADFSDGASGFAATVKGKGVIELRIDSKSGEKIGEIQFDTQSYQTVFDSLSKKISGEHDLYFIYGGSFMIENWQFAR